MKELSIEEKAKRYDGAIEQLRAMMPNWESLSYNGKTFLQDLVHIIPELKESEDWIPKEIIKYLKEKGDFRSCWIAWLEKQGEQKPTIEMKTPEESLGINSDTYNKIVDECIYGGQKSAEIVKWSPEEESCICQLESLVKEQWRKAEKVHNSVNVKKMSELMFFLKTLNPNKKPQRIISAEVKEAMYDKPAWSEEDEEMYEEVLTDIIYAKSDLKTKECFWLSERAMKAFNWFSKRYKSLRPQATWKPSEEQLKAIKWVMDGDSPENWTVTLANLYNDLKKLREE